VRSLHATFQIKGSTIKNICAHPFLNTGKAVMEQFEIKIGIVRNKITTKYN
jgi:hypothetical protein